MPSAVRETGFREVSVTIGGDRGYLPRGVATLSDV